jgi:hypothetical protein
MPVRRLLPLSAILATALALAAPASAAITVANTNDSGPGSLRQAIADAAPGETIVVPAGTYTLTSEELLTLKPLTLTGAGSGATVVRGAGNFRLFTMAGAGAVTISGMTFRDATLSGPTANGAGLLAVGTDLTLTDVVVTGNVVNADGGPGEKGGTSGPAGVLVSTGRLNLIDSSVVGNRATAVGGNGGEGGRAEAAGVLVVGSMQIVNSTIADNVSDARGGQGPANAAQVGGKAESAGLLAVQNTAAPSAILNSTISGNVADASGGPGAKGGSASSAGLLQVSNMGPLLVAGTTIAANIARAPGVGLGKAETGGALLVGNSQITVSGTTIASNAVEAPAAESGNLLAVNNVSFADSIVSGGVASAGTENCVVAGVTSLGFNIDSLDQCGFHAPGDKVNTDPQLGPLAFNGGPTRTMMPAFTSPAIDQGASFGMITDQRGVVRPIDLPTIPNAAAPGADGSDIGAVEAQPSNALALGKLKRNKKKGTAVLTVHLPAPSAGSLALSGRGLKTQRKSIAGQTEVRLKVAIRNKKVRRALRKRGRRKVGIRVTYSPTGNAAATATRKAKLVQKKKRKKRKRKHRGRATR